MVMIIIHFAYITCLVTNDACSGPVIFNGASNTVVGQHGYGRGLALNI